MGVRWGIAAGRIADECSGSAGGDSIKRAIKRALSFDDLVPILQPQEKALRKAEIPRQPKIKLRINRALTLNHLNDPVRRHADIAGKLGHAKRFRPEEFGHQQLPGMLILKPIGISAIG